MKFVSLNTLAPLFLIMVALSLQENPASLLRRSNTDLSPLCEIAVSAFEDKIQSYTSYSSVIVTLGTAT